ncbi:MAG TPA: hypothetical protein VEC37_02260, partial [Bacillota bacterium]|nr:hypothetical protein [Bacillota bacterium]
FLYSRVRHCFQVESFGNFNIPSNKFDRINEASKGSIIPFFSKNKKRVHFGSSFLFLTVVVPA